MPQLIFLIAPGFYKDPTKLALAIDLSRITFPFLFFICLASFFSAILNSYNKFAAAAAAPIILNVDLIVSLFFSQMVKYIRCFDFIICCFISRFFTIINFIIILLEKILNQF